MVPAFITPERDRMLRPVCFVQPPICLDRHPDDEVVAKSSAVVIVAGIATLAVAGGQIDHARRKHLHNLRASVLRHALLLLFAAELCW
jgi:hypothetical protein